MISTVDSDTHKREAARAAAELLPERGVVGLGTGSTTRFFIDEVGRLVGEGRRLTGVPTSRRSRELAQSLGIPLLDDMGPWSIDVCVDGADEVSSELDVIKGGGGAHTREKIVNRHAKRNVIIVDGSKLSQKLGERWPVPVEVVVFGHRATAALLFRFGTPALRMSGDGPFVTDSGNYIYDLATGPIAEPKLLEAALRDLPGVVESGLFCARTDTLIVASSDGISVRERA